MKKRNQFLDCTGSIIELKRARKRKSATITIAIPDETCEKFMDALTDSYFKRETKIKGLELSWIDTDIPDEEGK